jgi:hypothetical protein
MFSFSGSRSYLCYALGIAGFMLVQTTSGERNPRIVCQLSIYALKKADILVSLPQQININVNLEMYSLFL